MVRNGSSACSILLLNICCKIARGIIYGLAIEAKEEHYHTVLSLYKQATIQEERAKFLSALARSRNKALLQQTLDFSLSSDVNFSHSAKFVANNT